MNLFICNKKKALKYVLSQILEVFHTIILLFYLIQIKRLPQVY